MVLSRSARRRTVAGVGLPCVVAVAVWGELTTGSLLAVTAAGAVVAALALGGRAGAAAAPVGVRGRPWLLWLAVALVWEAAALRLAGVPALSDLLDPVLAPPPVRAAAAAAWLAVGGWLVARPSGEEER
jgi:hypothetical protein